MKNNMIAIATQLGFVLLAQNEPSGTFGLKPGKTMQGEWNAGPAQIVDSDFLTGATLPIYKDKDCTIVAELPVKIGWNTLTVFDCCSVKDIYYKK